MADVAEKPKFVPAEEVEKAAAAAERSGDAALAAMLRSLLEERETLRRMDREAATHVESVIIMRTAFTGDPPYVGWKGLGLALKEALDERDALKARAAS